MLLPYVREKFKPCPLFPHTADTIVKLSQRLMYTCVSSQSTQLSSCSRLKSEGRRIWLMDVKYTFCACVSFAEEVVRPWPDQPD